jgi:predicted MFS family arabinose efflux permease
VGPQASDVSHHSFFSVLPGLTYFADELWHMGALRFLVAMGVGGEWAVGAALVAEVFPNHARERAGGILHATSVIGL